MALLFLSPDDPAEAWRAELQARIPELDVRIWPQVGDPAEIDVALVWRPPPGELARYPNLRAILSLAAGIDGLIADPDLPDVPIARMVDPSLTRTMAEYVLLAVLRHHRRVRPLRARASERASGPTPSRPRPPSGGSASWVWASSAPPRRARSWRTASRCSAGAAARRRSTASSAIAGRSELHAFLHRTDILVCLLPLTADTVGILDAATFAELPHGACVINVARGQHLVEGDLVAALDSGHLAGATLDVFREEPLPRGSPLWEHPKVLVTPHVASYSRAGDRRRRRGDEHPPRSGGRAAAASGRPRARLLTRWPRPTGIAAPCSGPSATGGRLFRDLVPSSAALARPRPSQLGHA